MEVGELLVGKYRVERLLGRGGQGEVVQATNILLGQPVAMKFLLPEMASDHMIVQRFLREARAAVQLKSEHVARVLDVGTLDTAAPYIVFEYLEGADLHRWPRENLTLGMIVDFALQAAEALAEAHSKGIVHRDIKPANLFVTTTSDGAPCLKVLDFGISKVENAVGVTNLTASNTMLGTPSYASPEQLMSTKDIDHRTDIWSLGIVLYELVEGRVPYDAETLTQLVMKVMTEPLPPITANVPAEIVAAIERCLHKDPTRRFQSMGELAAALAPFAKSTEHAALLMRRASRISSPVIAQPSSSQPVSVVPHRTRSRWLIPAIVGAVAGTVIAAVLVLRGRDETAHAATPLDGGGEVHQMTMQVADAQATAEIPADAAIAIAVAIDAGEDRDALARRVITDVLAAVVARTAAHPTEACPTIESLGSDVVANDPWDTRLVVTCVDQPGDQIAGVISAGPDRTLGTDDDIRSWTFAPSVVAFAKGARFTPRPTSTAQAPISRTKPVRKPPVKTPKPKRTTPTGPVMVDRDGDGIPDVR